VAVAPDVLDLAALRQFLGEEQGIDGAAAAVVELDDGLVDLLVRIDVEVFLVNDAHDVRDDSVVAQHAAEHAALRLAVLRGQAVVEVAFAGHQEPPCAHKNARRPGRALCLAGSASPREDTRPGAYFFSWIGKTMIFTVDSISWPRCSGTSNRPASLIGC